MRGMWSKIFSYVPEWSTWGQAFLLFLMPILFLKGFQWVRSSIKKGTFSNKDQQNRDSDSNPSTGEETGSYANIRLTGKYATDLISVKETFGQNADVHIREFTIRGTHTSAAVMYVDGLVDHDLIDTHLVTPLMIEGYRKQSEKHFNTPKMQMNSKLI